MVRSHNRLEVEADGASPAATRIEQDGEPVRGASKLELVIDVAGASFYRLTFPAPIVTLSLREMPAVDVYRAQLVSTLGIDPRLDGLTFEGYSIIEALEGLIGRVRSVGGTEEDVEPR